jgi:hypothetical protein
MILNVTNAQYLGDYKILASFDNGETKIVDLEKTLFNETRKIFEPLKDKKYFQNFSIKFNTTTWENEVDFAPEYLYEIGIPYIEKYSAPQLAGVL